MTEILVLKSSKEQGKGQMGSGGIGGSVEVEEVGRPTGKEQRHN